MRILSDMRLSQGVFAALLCFALAGTVSAALALQYIWGFLPCELCLLERIPYYIGAVLAALAFAAALCHFSPKWAALLFLLIAGLMFYDAAVSAYHVGVELKYWQGPSSCSSAHLGAVPATADSLLENMNAAPVIPCDQIPGTIFGISFAGWNGIATFTFGIFAVFAAWFPFARRRTHSV